MRVITYLQLQIGMQGKKGFVFKFWFIQLKVAWVSVQQKLWLFLCVPLYLLQILAENSLSSLKTK